MLRAATVSYAASITPLAILLSRVAARDRSAFAALYQATSLKLYGTALRILKRKDMAEDVLQDVYVKIWERAGDYKAERGSPITWMATIARNRALDELRRTGLPASDEEIKNLENIPAPFEHPLAAHERREEHARLMNCLSQLDDEKRKMIVLAYQHGLSREDLANHFHHPVATVKTWLRRSLDMLKKCLDA